MRTSLKSPEGFRNSRWTQKTDNCIKWHYLHHKYEQQHQCPFAQHLGIQYTWAILREGTKKQAIPELQNRGGEEH